MPLGLICAKLWSIIKDLLELLRIDCVDSVAFKMCRVYHRFFRKGDVDQDKYRSINH